MAERSTWRSNTGFLLAAIGSAVGLGNIWRFSYLCYDNGGGTFLLPYCIALLVVGAPILILEFAIGHKMRASAPQCMDRVHPEWQWLGWWSVILVMFGIELYYTVVIAWCGLYMLYSLKSHFPWAEDPSVFFMNDFLGRSDGVFAIEGVQWPILAMSVFLWIVMAIICARRIDRGVEMACKIFMPALFLLTAILVFWGMTLDGALSGIRQYLSPDWSALGDVKVWRAASGQTFFTLSIGFGIMIAYASYLPPKTNLVKNAFITALSDSGYSIFAGLAVFSVLGYMAKTEGKALSEVVTSGPGLCFEVYPKAISMLPAMNSLFGFLFFMVLAIAGLTSAISILEAFTSAAIDKFGWKRPYVAWGTCAIGAMGSIIFTTHAGFYWLDIVDYFLNQYGLILIGLLECLLIVWYYKIDKLHFHLSDVSEGGYSRWWDMWWEWSVKYAAPMVLVVILLWSIREDMTRPYGGGAYPKSALMLIGGGWLAGTFLMGGIFSVYDKHRKGAAQERRQPPTSG